MSTGPERWIVVVNLGGEVEGEPKGYKGPADNGATTATTTYGESYRGIGASPEEALTYARAARASARPGAVELLEQLRDHKAGAVLQHQAVELSLPPVASETIASVRGPLGTGRVPPGMAKVDVTTLDEWIQRLAEEREG